MKDLKSVKSQVMDLLNQIVILTNGIEVPSSDKEDWNYRPVTVTDMLNCPEDYCDTEDDKEALEKWNSINNDPEKKEALLTQVYLGHLHDIASRLVHGKASSAEYNEQQYYTSNC